jgi:hypothetical protein
LAVTDGLKLGIHPAFGAPSLSGHCCATPTRATIRRPRAPFFDSHAGRCAVCLQISGVDHPRDLPHLSTSD